MKNLFSMKYLLIVMLSGMVSVVVAQDFEIRIQEENGRATVQIRCTGEPAPGTGDYLTDLVFGVKWQDERITELPIISGDYLVRASGGTSRHKEHFYRAFGVLETPYLFPEDWKKDQWVNIVTLRIMRSDPEAGAPQPRFEITEPRFHVTTGPNIGVNLKDLTPRIVPGHPID